MKKTAFIIILVCGLRSVTFAQSPVTNYDIIVNTNAINTVAEDDSALCQTAFNWGLSLGGSIVAALFVFWYIKQIPGGCHEES